MGDAVKDLPCGTSEFCRYLCVVESALDNRIHLEWRVYKAWATCVTSHTKVYGYIVPRVHNVYCELLIVLDDDHISYYRPPVSFFELCARAKAIKGTIECVVYILNRFTCTWHFLRCLAWAHAELKISIWSWSVVSSPLEMCSKFLLSHWRLFGHIPKWVGNGLWQTTNLSSAILCTLQCKVDE